MMFGDDFAYHLNDYMFNRVYQYQMFHQSQPSEFQFAMSTMREFNEDFNKEDLDNLFVKDGDYLPYMTDLQVHHDSKRYDIVEVWSGFYMTHTHLKQKIYDMMRLLTTYQNHESFKIDSRLRDHKEVRQLEESIAVLIHHDGITGTMHERVYDDYLREVREAEEATAKVIGRRNPALKGFKVTVFDQYFKLYKKQQLAFLNPYGDYPYRMNVKLDCNQTMVANGKKLSHFRMANDCFVVDQLDLSGRSTPLINLEITPSKNHTETKKFDKKVEFGGYTVEIVEDVHGKRSVKISNEKKAIRSLETEFGIYNQKNDRYKMNGHYLTRIDEVFYHKPQVDWHFEKQGKRLVIVGRVNDDKIVKTQIF